MLENVKHSICLAFSFENKSSCMKFKILHLFTFLFVSIGVFAQSGDWYNLDLATDGVLGISANKAYQQLSTDNIKPVIVAVIDDGVDIYHPDLAGKIWLNTGEIPDNGIDDDGNGYIDDVHGWNYLGNPSGENIKNETLEITRLYRSYKERFGDMAPESVSKSDQKAYKKYLEYKSAYEEALAEIEEEFGQFAQLSAMYGGAYAYMTERMGRGDFSLDDLMAFKVEDPQEQEVINFLLMAETGGLSEYLEEGALYFESALEYNYNLDFNPRTIVNEAEAREKNTAYGNPMVWASDPDHGTHVAGIVAAVRGNGLGVDGVASNAIIMPLRAVPAGDERDEDIALAIRYATDNGAKIINMSFGKSFSPNTELVDDAIRYAASKDVLMIHAAGNDAADNDRDRNYPDGSFGKRKSMSHWITVGASGPMADSSLIADFSNFGRKKVDVLAPGVQIESLVPEGGTKANSGTSMAAPVVSGLAAMIWGLYPELTATELKMVILKSVESYSDTAVYGPSGPVVLKKVVRYPGVVSAPNAIERAGK